MAAWSGTRLCRLDDLAEGTPRGFELGDGDDRLDVVVLRRGGRVIAYRNECPHAGSPLDLLPDQFLSDDGKHLLCHTHGALFRIDDGMCIAGPCLGRALVPVNVRVESGDVLIY
jgi:nitrite reductase/ring-hydroxylating ferredoxin subunit